MKKGDRDLDRSIAIIGMGCLFPGATDATGFWRNIVNGVDAVEEAPPDRQDLFSGTRDEKDPVGRHRRGGFVPGPYYHDPMRYKIMPNVARHGEAEQFVLLDVVSAALQDAGLTFDGTLLEKTDIIVGRGGYVSQITNELCLRSSLIEGILDFFRQHIESPEALDFDRLQARMLAQLSVKDVDCMATAIPNFVACRTANRLNLGGAAYVVDAACASSLVAVEQAVERLRAGRCERAIVAGSNFTHIPAFWHLFRQLQALSKQGISRPFDRRADGLLLAEGAGAVILERSADAFRRQHRIYALIRGVGSASDGAAAGMLSPSSDGQIRALQRAYDDAGVSPDSIACLEAHGTATQLGDKVELETIRRFFGDPATPSPFNRSMGSVKSMIGHAMPASGMASLIKSVFAVSQRILPPTLHCEEPRAAVAETPFQLLAKARPWIQDPASGPRRAAVNAFGFGGINAHVILEEAPSVLPRRGRSRKKQVRPCSRPLQNAAARAGELLLFSAPTLEALGACLRRVADFIARDYGAWTLTDLAFTLAQEADAEKPQRLALVVPREDKSKLEAQLRVLSAILDRGEAPVTDATAGIYYDTRASAGRLAVVFPGLDSVGSAPNSGAELVELALHFSAVREVLDAVDAVTVFGKNERPLSFLLAPPESLFEEERARLQDAFSLLNVLLQQDENSLSGFALPILQVLLSNWIYWRVLESLGVEVDFLCGQSVGEVSALCAGDCLSFSMLPPLLRRLLKSHPDYQGKARMAFVATDVETITPELQGFPELKIAMHPKPDVLMIGGPAAELQDFCDKIAKQDIIAQPLPFPPVHTPFIRDLEQQFRQAMADIGPNDLKPSKFPIYSSGHQKPYPEDAEETWQWLSHFLSTPVYHWQTFQRLYQDGARAFLFLGMGDFSIAPEEVCADSAVLSASLYNENEMPIFLRFLHLVANLFVRQTTFRPDALFNECEPKTQKLSLDTPIPAPPEPPGTAISLVFSRTPFPRHDSVDKSGDQLAPSVVAGKQEEPQIIPDAGQWRELEKAAAQMPFVGRILAFEPQKTLRMIRTFSLEQDQYLLDHLFLDLKGVKAAADALPVVPFTVSLEVMAEAAAFLAPGLGLIGYEDARAMRWISFTDETAFDLTVMAEVREQGPDGMVRVQVTLERDGIPMTRAIVRFASRYSRELTFHFAPPEAVRPFPLSAEQLYTERYLFHGPAFRCLSRVDAYGSNCIQGELTVLPTHSLFASCASPQLLGDPVVLDGAGQLVGVFFVDANAFVLPTGLKQLEIYRPPPPPGTRVRVYIEFTRIDRKTREVQARIEADDGQGGVWFRIEGWEDRLFTASNRIFTLLRQPRQHSLAELFSFASAPQVKVMQFFSPAITVRWDWLAQLYLDGEEWTAYRKISEGYGPRLRSWLLGRIAAKDAVREQVRPQVGNLHPALVCLDSEENGRPRVLKAGTAQHLPQVSISHVNKIAVAAAADHPLGIDVELRDSAKNLDPADFATSAEIERIRTLAENADDATVWYTRLWCAKEAAAKAAGTGLQGRPHAFELEKLTPSGQFRIRLRNSNQVFDGETIEHDRFVLALAVPPENIATAFD